MKIYATSSESASDSDELDVLGDETGLSVELSEVLKSIVADISPVLEADGEVVIEVSGSAKFRTSGGLKCMVLNIGGEVEASDCVKVTLKTRVAPIRSG